MVLYGEDVGGPMISRIEKVLDLVSSKYCCRISTVSQDAAYPERVLREAVVNALAHNDYSQRIPVTLSFDTESFTAVSCFGLPPENTEESVLGSGESVPGNPTLDEVLRLAGFMDLEGNGLEGIRSECTEHKASFRVLSGKFSVRIPSRTPFELEIRAKGTSRSELEKLVLERCDRHDGCSSKELVFDLRMSVRQVTRKFMTPLRRKGYLEFTIPEKPTSNLQRYRTTQAGKRR